LTARLAVGIEGPEELRSNRAIPALVEVVMGCCEVEDSLTEDELLSRRMGSSSRSRAPRPGKEGSRR